MCCLCVFPLPCSYFRVVRQRFLLQAHHSHRSLLMSGFRGGVHINFVRVPFCFSIFTWLLAACAWNRCPSTALPWTHLCLKHPKDLWLFEYFQSIFSIFEGEMRIWAQIAMLLEVSKTFSWNMLWIMLNFSPKIFLKCVLNYAYFQFKNLPEIVMNYA